LVATDGKRSISLYSPRTRRRIRQPISIRNLLHTGVSTRARLTRCIHLLILCGGFVTLLLRRHIYISNHPHGDPFHHTFIQYGFAHLGQFIMLVCSNIELVYGVALAFLVFSGSDDLQVYNNSKKIHVIDTPTPIYNSTKYISILQILLY
jgi:hypothetical protein